MTAKIVLASGNKGKVAELSAMYPRWQDFQAVRRQFDPQGQMLNAHLRQLFVKA